MNDLLGSLPAAVAPPPGNGAAATNALGDGRGGDAAAFDVEHGSPYGGAPAVAAMTAPTTPADAAMASFFASVDDINNDVERIKVLQGSVVDLHEAGKTLIKTKDVKNHQNDMQAKIGEVSKLARATKKKVDTLDKENSKARKLHGCEEGSANERTRTSITAALKKRMRDMMAEFADLRARMEDEYRQLVTRRLQTVTGNVPSDDAVEKVIDGGDGERIFQVAMEDEATRGRVEGVLAEIRERNVAVKELLSSLVELHQIFLDMSINVDAQGEMLDNIAKQVERSAVYVKGGTSAIVQAKNFQRNTRKWMTVAAVVVLIIIIIIILAVVRPWQYT